MGSPYTNPFGANALCTSACTQIGPWKEGYGSCGNSTIGTFTNVVTVYRDFDPTLPYNIVSATTGLVMDVTGLSTANGAKVTSYTSNGGRNQQWYIEREDVKSDSSTFRLRNVNSGLLLDVGGASTAQGAGVIQWADNGGANQRWNLVQMAGADYLLINVNSSLILQDGTHSGDQVKQQGTAQANQLWRFRIAQ